MAEKKDKEQEKKVVASHRKARQYYEILETYEAGIALLGPEVKSLRQGRASLDGCFGRCQGEELFLFNFYIPPYSFNTAAEPLDPRRSRKLLLRKPEIGKIVRKLQTKGLTLVPLEVYFRRGWAKACIALAKGKSGPDRREDLKKKDSQRDHDRSFKGKYKA
jgi:SsrA-binding protein